MVRKLRNADINKVADIWLDTNMKAHYFYLLNIGKVILN